MTRTSEIPDLITATTRKTGRTYEGQPTYQGILLVKAPWGKYTRRIGLERLTRVDALEDAARRRRDWIDVNQLPK